ncbi:MAG: hypothetical protein ACXWUG_23120 [Polyangiales bacterium]
MPSLERIALHQTRLRTPGLALDPSGVALGARGLVLLPTIERLVAFLSIYTRDRSFADLLGGGEAGGEKGLEVIVVRSPLKTREIVLSFPASSTTLLDLVADVARLAGGLTFTGTGRYFVQYRDRTAPFGYDVVELLRVEEGTDFALHHLTFTQAYARERAVDLAQLVARLEPRHDPSVVATGARPLWVSAEAGIAPALVGYLARSGVEAEVGIIELPAESSFDDGPRRVSIFRIAELPPRLEKLFTKTPGVRAFVPASPGVAVEVGHRHPIHLVGLPVFPSTGIALLPAARPGETRTPLVIDPLPQMAAVSALAGVSLGGDIVQCKPARTPGGLAVPLRLAPSVAGARQVTASLVPLDRAPLLRRLAYALPTSSLDAASIARVKLADSEALVLRIPGGVDAIPLGSFFSERAPGMFVLAGHDLVPAVAPQHLAQAVGATAASSVFVFREPGDTAGSVRAFSVESRAFVPLASALIEPESWGALMPVEVVELAQAELDEPIGTVEMGDLGIAPMRNV